MWETNESYEDLVEEVLDELLLERSGGKETVQVGPEEFSNKVSAMGQFRANAESGKDTYPQVGR